MSEQHGPVRRLVDKAFALGGTRAHDEADAVRIAADRLDKEHDFFASTVAGHRGWFGGSMPLRLIRSEGEYEANLARVRQLMDSDPADGTAEDDELFLRACTVEQWEKEHYPIDTSGVILWPHGEAAVEALGKAWADARMKTWTEQYGAEFMREVVGLEPNRWRREMRQTAATVLQRLRGDGNE